jgi:hypothetical protein
LIPLEVGDRGGSVEKVQSEAVAADRTETERRVVSNNFHPAAATVTTEPLNNHFLAKHHSIREI